jgi:tetratricopeptide (TPR) repeat protein
MEVDARHDHSFRIPRPDLSVKLGTPNACSNCHADRSPLWASSKIASWYGRHPVGYQQFAEALHAASRQLPTAYKMLEALAANPEQPVIARATAISQLGLYSRPETLSYVQQALASKDPMMRLAALDALAYFGSRERVELAFPLLQDEARSVRIQAARLLVSVSIAHLPVKQKELLEKATGEYIDAQLFSAERPESQVNLGGIYSDLGRTEEAVNAYRKAIELQKKFVPAYVNLAQLLSQQKDETAAISVLEQGITEVSDNASLYHALGLALVRQKNLPQALEKLAKAVELAPGEARYSYVYAIGLQSSGSLAKAIEVLETSHGLHPGNPDILFALVTINRDAGNREVALRYLQSLKKLLPDNATLGQLEQQLKKD